MTRDERDAQFIQQLLERIEYAPNRRVVQAYLDERAANDIKLATQRIDANHLSAWARFLGEKKFTDATKSDVMSFFRQPGEKLIQGSGDVVKKPLGKSSLDHRKMAIRVFQKWARDEAAGVVSKEFPPEVAWIKIKREAGHDKFFGRVLTRDELTILLEKNASARDRAILAALYDSGMRVSEFLSLKVGSVELDEFGAILTLPGDGERLKTGPRRVRVIHCAPYLARWLNEHPDRRNKNAPLWVSRSPRSFLKTLQPEGMRSLLLDAGKRAGIEGLHPHLFRHSRATEAVKEGMREAEMRIFFGWTSTSPMPGHYIHLGSDDVGDGILRRAGKLVGEKGRRIGALEGRNCPMCGEAAALTDAFCSKCRTPLTTQAIATRSNEMLMDALRTLGPRGLRDALKTFAEEENKEARRAKS